MLKMNNKWVLLIDGDMFAFRACASCEREVNWGQIWTLHVDLEEAKARFSEILNDTVEKALKRCTEHLKHDITYEILICFSSPNNFRKTINPAYKANRNGKRKPVAYHALVSWIKDKANTTEVDTLEADDVMGILATSESLKDKCIVISGDKDMKCIHGYHYDFIRDEFCYVTTEEAYKNFLIQTLMGDATDGYSGCPKIGKVTATKLLDKECSWDTVVSAYKKAGLSEDVALENARMARILLSEDWDIDEKKVKLWKPTGIIR